jgi:signal transduction histidine kinase
VLRWLHRTDLGLTVVSMTALAVVALATEKAGGLSVLGALAIVAACAPILLRSRRPLPALALCVPGIFAVLETCEAYELVALPTALCAFTVARVRGPRVAFEVAPLLGALVLLCELRYSPSGVVTVDTLKNLALVALPLVAGNMVRTKRAYVASLVERAEAAERARDEETLRRVEEERLRIAREVHDVVAHAMVAINVQAGVAAHLAERRPEQAAQALTEIKRVSGEALADLRATLGVLRTADELAPVRPSQGLDDLPELAERVGAAGVPVSLRIDTGRPVPSAVGTAAYRIVQEALTNVLRHAGAGSAIVAVQVGARAVELEVTDDGHGTTVPAGPAVALPSSGNGLRGMQERAAAVGGTVEAGAHAGGGWRVHARLPLPA